MTSPIRHRVLLVEDHDDSRAILVRLLQQHYDVTAATSYEAALAACAATQPDVVVTDIALGGSTADGVQLMREIRKTCPVFGIAISGYAPRDPQTLADAGLLKWFLKPIHFSDLLDAVEDACMRGIAAKSGSLPATDAPPPDVRPI